MFLPKYLFISTKLVSPPCHVRGRNRASRVPTIDSFSGSTPDLKWEKLAKIGQGKAAVVYLVRKTVIKEVQLLEWIHKPNHDGTGEHALLSLLQGHDNIQKVFHWDESNQVMVLKFANGGDLQACTLDHYGATREQTPEIFS